MIPSVAQPLRLEWMDVDQLKSNPANWRRHPPVQAKAMRAMLDDVGWAGALLFNERTGRLVDGHLRKEIAKGQKVPVLIGSWDEEQEAKILLTLDPLAAMAQPVMDALLKLAESSKIEDEAVKAMIEGICNGEESPLAPLTPEDAEIRGECICGACGNHHKKVAG